MSLKEERNGFNESDERKRGRGREREKEYEREVCQTKKSICSLDEHRVSDEE